MTGIFSRVEFNLPKTASGHFKIHKIEAEMRAFTTSLFVSKDTYIKCTP